MDFRQIIDIKEFGYPVITDVTNQTHSTQKSSARSGGNRRYVHMKKMEPNMVYLRDFNEILISIR